MKVTPGSLVEEGHVAVVVVVGVGQEQALDAGVGQRLVLLLGLDVFREVGVPGAGQVHRQTQGAVQVCLTDATGVQPTRP